MRNATQELRQLALIAPTLALMSAFALMTPSAANAQDPQQPDSYNNASGVPAEKPANPAPQPPTARWAKKSATQSPPTNRFRLKVIA